MSDQPIVLTEAEYKVFDVNNTIMKSAIKKKDDRIIAEYVIRLRRQGQMTGLALAHTLYLWRKNAEVFGDVSDFEDKVHADTGLSVQTVRKYSTMWEAIFEGSQLEDHVRRLLMEKPVGELLLISPAAKEDQLSPDQWEKLSEAVDRDEIREVIREVRGQQTSSNTALIIRVRRDGVLEAKRGTGEFTAIGYFAMDKRDNATVDAAISRLIRAAGVIEQ